MIVTGNNIIDAEINKINKSIIDINKRIDALVNLFGKAVTLSDLRILQRDLDNKTQQTATLVAELESRLNMIKTPDETRFYLEESEIEDFRINFTKLSTMISDVNDTYTSLTTYLSTK